jgi:hypothetical protein
MIYIKTILSSRVDDYTESLGVDKVNLRALSKGVNRIRALLEVYRIFSKNRRTTIYISEERLEFRLMTYIFVKCHVLVVHPGLLFSQRLSLSNKLYRLFYPTFLCIPFNGVNGLNKFKSHIVFYEENMDIILSNNPAAKVALVERNDILEAVAVEKSSVLLVPSAWSHHALFAQEKEQLSSFLFLSNFFKENGIKVYYKPHPRGDYNTDNILRSHLGEEIRFIDKISEFPGNIVVGNISTLLVDLKDAGFTVYKYITETMQDYSNSAIDNIKEFDRFEHKG